MSSILKINELSEIAKLPISPVQVLAKIGVKKFKTDEIILAASYHLSRNIDLSLRLAMQLAASKGSVLYLNTLIRHEAIMRKTLDLIKGHKLGNPNVGFLSFLAGDLSSQGEFIRNYIAQHKVKAIVLNSWEYSTLRTSDKRALTFMLKGICNDFEVCLVVFTQEKPEHIEPGKIKRGSIGLFAGLSDEVIDFNKPGQMFDELFSTLGGQQEELRPKREEAKPKADPEDEKKFPVNEFNNLQLNGHHGNGKALAKL